MIMNKLLGSIDEANYSLDRVVICKGPFDQHISNCIENLMTEREEINKFLIAPSQSCTIARMAKTDGIVLELGETGASCCTIYDGTILKGSMFTNNKIGGLKLVK
ncbi:actin [Gregarina niphandrodes]|uniref:Actin n=1 Tax=Gregarina niphandrodes TaxID=110365 RepID=A0A023AZY3_GRENI|nr:actin [Gregarina niphandrodes]EZG44193.1 actin [Gregarina niphandrodes]|eukprot:XP_011132761.1 actin [Gregarina niphandrodes]